MTKVSVFVFAATLVAIKFSFLNQKIFIDAKELHKIKVTGLKCVKNSSVYNGTLKCLLKPSRDQTGTATLLYNLTEPANDIWVQLKVFYKYTNEYRQWLFDFDINICKIMKGVDKPNMLQGLVLKSLFTHYPTFVHKCPYHGWEGVTDLNITKVINSAIPQLVPTGDYRLLLRYHLTDNTTFLAITISGHVDALNILERVEMGKK